MKNLKHKHAVILVLTLSVFACLIPSRSHPAASFESPEDRAIIERFHQIFYGKQDTWIHNKYLGVTALQNPFDAWITQEIITDVKPDYFIELGTAEGGGALIWANVLEQLNPAGKVITVDIEDKVAPATRKMRLWKKKIEFIVGSSIDPKVIAKIKKRVKGKRVVVLLDSDHKKDHVLQELKEYSPMISLGSYIIVQDSNVNGHPVYGSHGPGPMEALKEFLQTNKNFVSDPTRERMLFTFCPKGYLRRIK